MQLSPAVAGTMLKVDQFWQHDPKDGQPISQKTEAYLGYTDKNLYVIFLAFDNAVDKLRNHMVRREQINEEDQVGIFLDTFHDHRHCVFFFINPAGSAAGRHLLRRPAGHRPLLGHDLEKRNARSQARLDRFHLRSFQVTALPVNQ